MRSLLNIKIYEITIKYPNKKMDRHLDLPILSSGEFIRRTKIWEISHIHRNQSHRIEWDFEHEYKHLPYSMPLVPRRYIHDQRNLPYNRSGEKQIDRNDSSCTTARLSLNSVPIITISQSWTSGHFPNK